MVIIKKSHRDFARIVTWMHDAANLLEQKNPDETERDEVRSRLRLALELLVMEEKQDA